MFAESQSLSFPCRRSDDNDPGMRGMGRLWIHDSPVGVEISNLYRACVIRQRAKASALITNKRGEHIGVQDETQLRC